MRYVFVLAFAGLCAACSSSPSAGAAANQLGQSLCEKVEECEPSSFNDTYESQQECIDKIRAGANTGGKRSACSQSELNACTRDIKKATCKANGSGNFGGAIDMPPSCKKC